MPIDLIKRKLLLLDNPFVRNKPMGPAHSVQVLGPAVEDLLLQCIIERIQWIHTKQMEFLQRREERIPPDRLKTAPTFAENYEGFWHFWTRFSDQIYALIAARYANRVFS